MSSCQAPTLQKVSIITVVYNCAGTIERTIQSVLSQQVEGIEYIIVDGGSTDGTLDIVRKYETLLSKWHSGPDSGIYDAMNKGIAMATGEWVGFINADDHYAAGAVAKVLEAVVDKPWINVVHGDIMIHYGDGKSKVKKAKQSGFLLKYWEMVLNHPSFFVRRSYYSTRPFDSSFRVSGDHLWTLGAWMEDRRQFLYLPEVLAHFNLGGASTTNPLRRVLSESDRIADALKFTPVEKQMARLVRVALHFPSMLKLKWNKLLGRPAANG